MYVYIYIYTYTDMNILYTDIFIPIHALLYIYINIYKSKIGDHSQG